MRSWAGQQMQVGDKVYKVGSTGSSMYSYVAEIVKYSPGSSRVSLVEEIHPSVRWIDSPTATNPGRKFRVEHPGFSSHWRGGPPRPSAVGLHTVFKINDQEYKEVVERTHIAQKLSDSFANQQPVLNSQAEFYNALEYEWNRAGL